MRKPEQHLMAVVPVWATKCIRFLLFSEFDKILTKIILIALIVTLTFVTIKRSRRSPPLSNHFFSAFPVFFSLL